MIARESSELELRVARTQETLDAWKGRAFDWKARSHCARMVTEHLRLMGYTPPLSKAGPFASERAALAALKRLGAATLADAVDMLNLPRIAPAAALAGDIVELPSASALGCLTIAVGNGRVLGFHADAADAVIMHPQAYGAAWRVVPR